MISFNQSPVLGLDEFELYHFMINPPRIWWLSCEAYKRRHFTTARLLKMTNYVLFRCILPFEAEIERDLELSHWALGVVSHPNVTIGKRVRIYHQVTFASETWVGSPYRIRIGDDVRIGAGVIVIARGDQNLNIGHGAVIGAGAVVTRDVEPGEVVAGVPARSIRPI